MKLFDNRITLLLLKQLRHELEPNEEKELATWLNASKENEVLASRIRDEQYLKNRLAEVAQYDEEAALSKFWTRFQPEPKAKVVTLVSRRWWYVAVTAGFILVIGAVGYNYLYKAGNKKPHVQTGGALVKDDKAPGRDGAVLKLANGQEIVLDNAPDGNIGLEGNTHISKVEAVLSYEGGTGKNQEAVYNTLSTSRGRQFQLALPDGSKVWLNAASSITYPTAFTGNERSVEVTGEAYFEVAHNKDKPFIVAARGMKVEVLGTHFNINAYDEETTMKTTLLEGAVRVSGLSGNGPGVKLKPGQQAQVYNITSTTPATQVIDHVDLNAAVAWKNGLIVFNDAGIKEILRQISRWYNVDIVYTGDINVAKFYGEIPRTVNLSEVLKIIEINSRLQFAIEGNKVTVKQP